MAFYGGHTCLPGKHNLQDKWCQSWVVCNIPTLQCMGRLVVVKWVGQLQVGLRVKWKYRSLLSARPAVCVQVGWKSRLPALRLKLA